MAIGSAGARLSAAVSSLRACMRESSLLVPVWWAFKPSLDCYEKGYGRPVPVENFTDFLRASHPLLIGVRHDRGAGVKPFRKESSRMKLNRWIVLPAAGLAAVIIGVVAVQAAPSPAASPNSSKSYAQVFVDKLAGILGLTPAQTQDALKKAQLATVDQMLADGQITKAQADAMKARINAGQGLGAVGGFGLHGGGFKAHRTLMNSLMTAELNA